MYGTGLKLLDYPEIKLINMDPCLFDAINPQGNGEKLEVSVIARLLFVAYVLYGKLQLMIFACV